MRKHNQIHTLGAPHYKVHFRFEKINPLRPAQVATIVAGTFLAITRQPLEQEFPTFFAARTPLSGQSNLSTPKKIEIYIAL